MPTDDKVLAERFGYDPNAVQRTNRQSQGSYTDEEIARRFGYELPESSSPKVSGRTEAKTSREERRKKLIEENQIAGIPLNIDDGAPLWERAMASFREDDDPEQKLDFWKTVYGEDGARYLNDGSIAVLTTDKKTNQLIEMRVDEAGATMKDFADMAYVAPELAGDALAFWAARTISGTGLISRAFQAGAAAIGGQTAAGLTEGITDLIDDRSVEVRDIIKKRGKMAAVDFVLNLAGERAFSAAGRTLGFSLDAFGRERGMAQEELVKALKFIEKKTGHKIEASAAQLTGDPKLARLEALVGNIPGGQEAFLEFKQLQKDTLEAAQKYLIGKENVLSQEDIHTQVYKGLRNKLDTVEEHVSLTMEDTLRLSTKEVMDSFNELSLPQRASQTNKHALVVQGLAVNDHRTFESINRQKFGKVYSIPEANEEIFRIKGLSNEAKEIRKGLLEKTIVDTIDTGILSATGKPITQAKIKKVPVKAFVPKGLLSKIDEIVGLSEETTTLNKMVQARRTINDAIKQGEVLTGFDTRRLRKMSHAITEEIDRVANTLPNGAFKAALDDANSFYKNNFKKYLKHGVAQLLLDPTEPGGAEPRKFVQNLIRDPDAYANLKDVLGGNPRKWAIVKRVAFDRLLQDAGVSRVAGGYVDGLALRNALTSLEKVGGHEMLEDLVGKKLSSNLKAAINANWAAKVGKAGIKANAEVRVPLREVMEMVRRNQGPPSVKALRTLFNQQDELAELNRNKIISDVVGIGKTTNIEPSSFVEDFVMGASTKDFNNVVKIIGRESPDLLDEIRAKAVQNYFLRAEGMRSPNELLRHIKIAKNDPMTADSMLRALGHENQIKNFETLIGKESLDVIRSMSTVRAVLRNTDDIGGIAGGLLGGAIMNSMFRNPVHGGVQMIKYRIASRMILSPMGRWLLKGFPKTSRSADKTMKLFGSAWVLSQPGLSAMREEFPEETEFMAALDVARELFETDKLTEEEN